MILKPKQPSNMLDAPDVPKDSNWQASREEKVDQSQEENKSFLSMIFNKVFSNNTTTSTSVPRQAVKQQPYRIPLEPDHNRSGRETRTQ